MGGDIIWEVIMIIKYLLGFLICSILFNLYINIEKNMVFLILYIRKFSFKNLLR